MATIIKSISVAAPAAAVWEALRSVGEVHTRLAPGFVIDTKMERADVRVVTFANGVVARERIIGIDDDARRLAYTVLGSVTEHHSASFQVFPDGPARSRLVWITDVLPDEAAAPLRPMIEGGAAAIQRALAARPTDQPSAV